MVDAAARLVVVLKVARRSESTYRRVGVLRELAGWSATRDKLHAVDAATEA